MTTDADTMTALHTELLILLKTFHRLCSEHGIRYSLHGGTLLGAVREHGFIPWDDDADISITRDEYRKLLPLLESFRAGNTPIQFLGTWCPRLLMRREGKPVVWLDLYIWDFISENRLAQRLKFAGLAFLMAWLRTDAEMELTKAHGKYRGWQYWAIDLVHLLGKPFRTEWKEQVAGAFSQSFPGRRSLIHRSNDQFAGLVRPLPTHVMEGYKLAAFEDTCLMISVSAHEILCSCYGADYRTPKPPGNDAKSHAMFRRSAEKRTGCAVEQEAEQ